jgi:uncharacterized membrane protein YjjP (DUF1212 family)
MRDQLASGLLCSAVTFRRCIAEKVLFIALNCLDMTLTLLAISIGLTELNPLMVKLVHYPFALLLFKVGLPAFIAWLVPGKWLYPSIALISLIVAWDVRELLLFFF